MKQNDDVAGTILELLQPVARQIWFYKLGSIRVPERNQNHMLFHLKECPEGQPKVAKVNSGEDLEGSPQDLIVAVRHSFTPFELTVLRDWKGDDFVVSGTLMVMPDGREFVKQAYRHAAVGRPLAAKDVDRWIDSRLVGVRDALKSELGKVGSISELIRSENLPMGWWGEKLSKALEPLGLNLVVALAKSVPNADSQTLREAELKAREEEARRQHEQRSTLAGLEARHAKELRQLEEEKLKVLAAIEQKGRAGEMEMNRVEEKSARKIKEVEDRFRMEQLQGVMEMKKLQQELADLRCKQENRQEEKQVLQKQSEDLKAVVDQLKVEIKVRNGFEEKVLELLSGPRNSNAVGWLTECGVTSDDLKNLGLETPAALLQQLPEGKVSIRLKEQKRNEVSTRDVFKGSLLAKQKKSVKGVNVGDRLDFTLKSPRDGFVSIINLGTSGRVWLLTPGPDCKSPKVTAERTYHVPSHDLLMLPEGDTLEEGGPAGEWEWIVVIVSKEPLFTKVISRNHPQETGFVELMPEDVKSLFEKLGKLGDAEWASGVERFLVYEEES